MLEEEWPREHARGIGGCTGKENTGLRSVDMIEEQLTEQIIGGAIEVHRHWGPGLYEEVYERSLYRELQLRDVSFESQLKLPLIYKEEKVGEDLRLDLIVGSKVVVELKAVKELEPIHEAQLLTYMRITGCRVGLLINFNVPVLKDGIKRMVL
jgi:GxxExxY protein